MLLSSPLIRKYPGLKINRGTEIMKAWFSYSRFAKLTWSLLVFSFLMFCVLQGTVSWILNHRRRSICLCCGLKSATLFIFLKSLNLHDDLDAPCYTCATHCVRALASQYFTLVLNHSTALSPHITQVLWMDYINLYSNFTPD